MNLLGPEARAGIDDNTTAATARPIAASMVLQDCFIIFPPLLRTGDLTDWGGRLQSLESCSAKCFHLVVSAPAVCVNSRNISFRGEGRQSACAPGCILGRAHCAWNRKTGRPPLCPAHSPT